MYAVFVIAAILLSVAPMHARTLLAALPSSTPGHQFAPDSSAARPHVAAAARTQARIGLPAGELQATVQATVPFPTHAPALRPASLFLADHAPNAP
jgi:hypothetical protein